MSFPGMIAQNHPQQTRYRGSQRHVDDRALPMEDFQKLNERFKFTIDVSASIENAKMPRFFTEADNAIVQSWRGERVYCNPPYSDIRPWINKAWAEIRIECPLVVMLLPANRTEQSWWQEGVERIRDRPGTGLRTEFLKGRQRFLKPGQKEIGPNERPPFGMVLLIWSFEEV